MQRLLKTAAVRVSSFFRFVIFPGGRCCFIQQLSRVLSYPSSDDTTNRPVTTTNGRQRQTRSVRAGTCRCRSAAGDRVTVGTRRRSGTRYGGRRGVRRHKAPPLPYRRRSVASRSPIVADRLSSSSSSRFLDRHRRRSFFRFIHQPFPRWAEALRCGRKR